MMKLSSEIEEILRKDGGWMSSTAILNRCETACTVETVRAALDELVQMDQVQQIHGVSGLEYALVGVKPPAIRLSRAPVIQGKVEDVQIKPEDLDKHRAPAAPSLIGASRTAQPVQSKPPSTRDRVLKELAAAGKNGADTVQLMNRTGCSFGNVQNAISDLRAERKVHTEKVGDRSVYFIAAPQPIAAPDDAAVASTQPTVYPERHTLTPSPQPHARGAAGDMRDKIKRMLGAEPGLSGKVISERLGLASSTVSYHLRKIEAEASSTPAGRSPADDQQVMSEIKRLMNVPSAIVTEREHKDSTQRVERTSASFALWSTGELLIKRGDGETLSLDVSETRALLAYLDRMALVEGAAA